MGSERRPAKELREQLARLSEQPGERLRLLHELRVYQEELTTQNEALMQAQAVLEETRDRFVELYDFAPNGYMTLDAHGLVLQINLTGAALLGKQRHTIEGLPFIGFVETADRAPVLDFLRR